MAKPPTIPSKNALRHLRRLALGGSTVLGAIGGVCGFATVSYDVHRRIRLAEKILETKRTIRSVSNRSGAAQIAQMFEAAEKGEDFSLDAARERRNQKARNYSTHTEELSQWTPAGNWQMNFQPQLEKAQPSDMPILRNSRLHRKSAHHIIRDATINATKPSSHNVYARPRRQRTRTRNENESASKLSAADRIMVATKQQHKLHDHTVFGRPHKVDRGSTLVLPECVDQWLNHAKAGKDLQNSTEASPANNSLPPLQNITSETDQTSAFPTITPSAKLDTQNTLVDSEVHPASSPAIEPKDAPRTVSQSSPTSLTSPSPEEEHGNTFDAGQKELENTFQLEAENDTENLENTRGAAPVSEKLQSVNVAKNEKMDDRRLGAEISSFDSLPEDKFSHSDYRAQKKKSLSELARSVEITLPQQIIVGTDFKPWPVFKPEVTAAADSTLASPPDITKHTTESDQPQFAEDAEGIELSKLIDQVSDDVDAFSAKLDALTRSLQQLVQGDSSHSALRHEDLDISSTLGGLDQSRLSEIGPLVETLRAKVERAVNERAASDLQFRTKVSRSGIAQVVDCFTRVQGQFRISKAQGQSAWAKSMVFFAQHGANQDMDMVDVLLEKFSPKVDISLTFQPVRRLVHHLLIEDRHSQPAADLLFPTKVVRDFHWKLLSPEISHLCDGTPNAILTTAKRNRWLMTNATQYLNEILASEANGTEVLAELRKVIAAARRKEVVVEEALFAPVLRFLCQTGDMAAAQSLFDEMIYYHQIRASFYTRSMMVRGYAWVNDWPQVEKDIEAMHDEGYSRKQPHGFARMFNGVFRHYAATKSVHQTHNMLVHAASFWGLVPTSEVSATAIQSYLTYKRYDLIQDWVETVKVLFPQIETETRAFAWQLGETWEKIRASCQDIEKACEAMAFQGKGIPFSGGFRAVAREAVARDLAAKLHAAERVKDFDDDDDVDEHPPELLQNVKQYAERARSLAAMESPFIDLKTHAGKVAADLNIQIASVARLNSIFQRKDSSGKTSKENPVGQFQSHQFFEQSQAPSKLARLISGFPPDLIQEFLPNLETITAQLDQYYEARAANRLKTEHSILPYVCDRLRKQTRFTDAIRLLRHIFASPFVQRPPGYIVGSPPQPQGIMFDLPIMELWLRLAYEMRSVVDYRKVLWAVLEVPAGAGNKGEIRLTSKFCLLAGLARQKIQNHRFSNRRSREYQEMSWLLMRLKTRLWEQQGREEWRFGESDDLAAHLVPRS